jgi:hypothetical protein
MRSAGLPAWWLLGALIAVALPVSLWRPPPLTRCQPIGQRESQARVTAGTHTNPRLPVPITCSPSPRLVAVAQRVLSVIFVTLLSTEPRAHRFRAAGR